MGRPPDPERREEVLTRAVAFLAAHGLSNLTLRKLAAAMGTSTNTISYQFGSKEGLIEAALDRARAVTLDTLDGIRAQEPAVDLNAAIEQLWDWWMADEQNLVATRLNMEAMVAADEDVPRDRRPELLSFWIDYFAQWVCAERACSREEAVTRSTLLMAVLSGLVIDLQSTGDAARTRASLISYLSTTEATPTSASTKETL